MKGGKELERKALSGIMLTEVPKPPEMPPEAPQPTPKKGRTGLYIGLVLIVSVIVVGAIALQFIGTPSLPLSSPTKPIHHIDYFLVTEEGQYLQAQFALMSEDLNFISTDGTVQLTIFDETTNRTLYETEFTLKKSDFKHYQTLLGKTILAYQWSIPLSNVQKCISNGIAKITFTATSGKSCSDTDEYVMLPKHTEEEIIQMYEDMYLQSAITVQQTITKGEFTITLVRVGHFTHLEYDTWGDEVTEFRVDLKVKNIASQPEYLFESDIVILDNLGNQYDYEWGGTLDLGEIYPGVTREGYVLFPALNENAIRITLIVTKMAFPEDIVYEFTVNL